MGLGLEKSMHLGSGASQQGGTFGWPAAWQRWLAPHGPGLDSPWPGREQCWSGEVVECCLLLMEVVYVTGNQKRDFKNLKQEKQNGYTLN